VFDRLLRRPKRTRAFAPFRVERAPDGDRILSMNPGARIFLQSLGDAGQPYLESMLGSKIEERLIADERIREQKLLMHYCCGYGYAKRFPRDPFLQLWSGLGFLARGSFTEALCAFDEAIQNGLNEWRIGWYRACALEQLGRVQEAVNELVTVLKLAPDFDAGCKMQQRLPMPKVLPEQASAALQYVQEAERLVKSRQLVQARGCLERALRLVPEQILIFELLADLDCRLGRLDSARQLLAIILQREPRRSNPRLAAITNVVSTVKQGDPAIRGGSHAGVGS
ncbi:MAG TPA: hypothetical protein VL069_16320, partial [Opitutus sp.]|nr:hypothetical protein [Opitutus sp.]